MNSIVITLIQAIIILGLAPFCMGLVRMFKARMQGRHGASPFLPYITLATFMRKQMVISTSTSWVFRVVPFVVLSTTIFLALVLPLASQGGALSSLSDFVVVAGILSLGAIFLVLGGLDGASAFGGMGSSREMTIASLIEPTVIVAFATVAIVSQTHLIDGMIFHEMSEILERPYLLLVLISLLLIALAENARYPVDNPATHLELTMVHEAMVLEYSGPYLAMLEYASALKLTIFSLLAVNLFFPVSLLVPGAGLISLVTVIGMTVIKLVVMMFLLALLESSIAKMRFFRMQEYLSVSFFVSLAGLVLVLINLV